MQFSCVFRGRSLEGVSMVLEILRGLGVQSMESTGNRTNKCRVQTKTKNKPSELAQWKSDKTCKNGVEWAVI